MFTWRNAQAARHTVHILDCERLVFQWGTLWATIDFTDRCYCMRPLIGVCIYRSSGCAFEHITSLLATVWLATRNRPTDRCRHSNRFVSVSTWGALFVFLWHSVAIANSFAIRQAVRYSRLHSCPCGCSLAGDLWSFLTTPWDLFAYFSWLLFLQLLRWPNKVYLDLFICLLFN